MEEGFASFVACLEKERGGVPWHCALLLHWAEEAVALPQRPLEDAASETFLLASFLDHEDGQRLHVEEEAHVVEVPRHHVDRVLSWVEENCVDGTCEES